MLSLCWRGELGSGRSYLASVIKREAMGERCGENEEKNEHRTRD